MIKMTWLGKLGGLAAVVGLSTVLPVNWAIANSGPYAYYHEKEVSVEGCLYGGDGNFTVVDDRGNTFQLTGKKAMLSDFVGQRVRLKGEASSNEGKASAMSENEGRATPTLRVSKVKHVSQHACGQ